ncbi:MAG: hypothetical protein ACOC5D_02740 [Thermoplasmatota archaeon]
MYNSYEKGIIRSETVIDGADSDATSNAINCIGARRIALELSSDSDLDSRSGEFKVQASIDEGETFHDLNKLIENTSNDRDALADSITIDTADNSVLVFVDGQITGAITYIKVDLVVTDTSSPAGTFSAKVSVQK